MSDAFEQLLNQLPHKEDFVRDEFDEVVRAGFTSPGGKKLLKLLNEYFVEVPLFVAKDTHATAYRVAQSDLVNYFNDVLKDRS